MPRLPEVHRRHLGNDPIAAVSDHGYAREMRLLVCLVALTFGGCADKCKVPEDGAYEGVVLAIGSGVATFATQQSRCVYKVVGTGSVQDRIYEQWRISPYEGEIRPVYVSIRGTVIRAKEKDQADIFDVKELRDASVVFAEEQVAAAFSARLGRRSPKRWTGGERNDPDKRIELTD